MSVMEGIMNKMDLPPAENTKIHQSSNTALERMQPQVFNGGC